LIDILHNSYLCPVAEPQANYVDTYLFAKFRSEPRWTLTPVARIVVPGLLYHVMARYLPLWPLSIQGGPSPATIGNPGSSTSASWADRTRSLT
jgi:hypothetical protein